MDVGEAGDTKFVGLTYFADKRLQCDASNVERWGNALDRSQTDGWLEVSNWHTLL